MCSGIPLSCCESVQSVLLGTRAVQPCSPAGSCCDQLLNGSSGIHKKSNIKQEFLVFDKEEEEFKECFCCGLEIIMMSTHLKSNI